LLIEVVTWERVPDIENVAIDLFVGVCCQILGPFVERC
jgi:hypothetical protein